MAKTRYQATTKRKEDDATNDAMPVENFGTIGISLPYSSRALWIEKVARRLVIAIQSVASARYRPTLAGDF